MQRQSLSRGTLSLLLAAFFTIVGLTIIYFAGPGERLVAANDAAPLEIINPANSGSGSAVKLVRQVEVVRTPQRQEQGLSHRSSIPEDYAMLFVYQPARRVTFWMKDTLIPLDLIFVAAGGKVVKVAANQQPGDLGLIPSPGAVVAVVEMQAHRAAELEIRVNSIIRHPAINNSP